ncbi:MAG: GerAB/ArcD/ProY family transporter [Lachnospiraceae bacterium]|nr:GerAB/ArcD/ProY family transporter [Lachnospiraceae bacterium]
MFSHNGLISEKQMRSMLMLYVFSSGIFVLPYLFALMFGKELLAGVMVFLPVASIYVWIMTALSENISGDSGSGGCSTFYVIVSVVRYIIRLAFYIILAVSILSEGQVPFVDEEGGNSLGNLFVLLPLLLVALYGAGHNLEKQGRLSEMIAPAAMFPYVIMILFGIKDVSLSECCRLLPVNMSVSQMLLNSYALLTFIVPVEIYPELRLRLGKDNSSKFKFYISVFFVIILEVILSVLMAGIYGINGISAEPMATVSIMRYIELPLGILQRFDVLMVWFFMTGCFALLCSSLFYIRRKLKMIVAEKSVVFVLAFILAAACLIAYMCPGYKDMVGLFVVYGALADVPLSIIMLVVRRTEYRRKMAALSMLVMCAVFLSGCTSDIENIEQRDYATVLMISPDNNLSTDNEKMSYNYTIGIAREHHNGEKSERENITKIQGNGLEDLSKKYGGRRGKNLSLSHLKVILIAPVCADCYAEKEDNPYGEKTEQRKANNRSEYLNLSAVIEELDEQEEVAKTCPLLFVYDEKKITDFIDNADEPVGTYISNLVKISEKNHAKIPKLMDYLKALRDGIEIDVAALADKEDNLIIVK